MRIHLLATSGAVALVLAACPSYDARVVVPESIKEVNKTVAGAKPLPVDILFVVDNSGSMVDEQDNLARNFGRFIEVLATSGADYQLAVVTTDLNGEEFEQKGVRTFPYSTSGPYFQLLNNGSGAGCMPTDIRHGCFRGDDPAFRILRSEQTAAADIQTRFQNNVRVGTCGSGAEKGLESMLEAIRMTSGTQCNAGFLRPSANLVVVMVSDEEDDDFAGGSPRPIAQIISDLTALKPIEQIRFAAVVGAINGQASRCGRQATCGNSVCNAPPIMGSGMSCGAGQTCPADEQCNLATRRCEAFTQSAFTTYCWWCTYFNAPDCCLANSGTRYVDFAKQIGAAISAATGIPDAGCQPADGARATCLIDSICQEEFDRTLTRVARDLVITDTFALTPPANYPDGIVVEVAGESIPRCSAAVATDCFSVETNAQGQGTSIRLLGKAVPSDSNLVEVFYTVAE